MIKGKGGVDVNRAVSVIQQRISLHSFWVLDTIRFRAALARADEKKARLSAFLLIDNKAPYSNTGWISKNYSLAKNWV